MKSTTMMAKVNIGKKKTESLLIGTSIALSAMVLQVALGLFTGLDQPFEDLVRTLKTPHLMLFFDTQLHDGKSVSQWFSNQDGVLGVTPLRPVYQTGDELIHKGEKIEKSLLLAERGPEDINQEGLLASDGSGNLKTGNPAMGELWLPNHFAKTHGIVAGDRIGIPTVAGMRELTVSALVVDPYFSSGNISPVRAWVAPGSLAVLLPLGELAQSQLGVRLAEPGQAEHVMNRFRESLGGNYAGWFITYGIAKLAFGLFYNIVAAALLVVAMFATVIAVFMISATITSAVFSDYKMIGILKAQGFTPAQVNRIYQLQFLTVSSIFLPAGIGLGWLITRGLFASLAGTVGLEPPQQPAFLSLFVPFMAVLAIVFLSSWWTSRKAGRVKPMEAIRFGAPLPLSARKAKSASSWVQRFSPSLLMGFRNLSVNRKRTLFGAVGMGMAVFVLVFSVNIVATFSGFGKNKALWGMDAGDLSVQLTSKRFRIKDSQFAEMMAKESLVAGFLPIRGCSATIPTHGGQPPRDIFGQVYDGDMDAGGLLNLEGQNPVGEDQVSLGVNTAKRSGIKVGDRFSLFIEGQVLEFTVSGIFQTAMNFGEGFRLQAAVLKKLMPDYRARSFSLFLKPGSDPEAFKRSLKEKLGEAVEIRTAQDNFAEMKGMIDGMRLTLTLLSLVLLAVCFATIFNDTLLGIKENAKTFGILKTMGMTPHQLRFSAVSKTLALTALSLAVAVPLSLAAIPKLLSVIAAGIGLVRFPLTVDSLGTAMIVPGLLFFAFVCAWLPAGKVLRLNPRQLIVE